ncbi:MAG: helix-turn-helix domain-containing protein [Promicromonosporaceae bacterium]|nr:helix-turn-helix domain-containing protein [Promicromonosporaceae bacterium]
MAEPPVDDVSARDAGASRVALLKALRTARQAQTVQELAAALGLHPNSVRFHLSRLAAHGLVTETQAPPAGRGRPRLVYAATEPAPAVPTSASGPHGHQLLATALSAHLAHTVPHPEQIAVDAGTQQGRALVARDPAAPPATAEEGRALLTTLMRDQGFGPEWDPDGERLWLRTCPFRPEADVEPNVVCNVHLGLMRGALDAAGAPLEVTSLDAAPAPHPCLAMVRAVSERIGRSRPGGTAGRR